MTAKKQSAYRFPTPTRSEKEVGFNDTLQALAEASDTSNVERFMNFPAWVPRQKVGRFLAQWDIYRNHILPTHGSIVEGGVAFGAGVFTWAHFISIMEPANHTRRVIGFDTFEGFPSMSPQDAGATSGLDHAGGMAAPVEEELAALAKAHDTNRANGHIPRVELVKGDACSTMVDYVKANPHLVVAALVLDFDIYEPTRDALKLFMPRMPKGAVIVFDEVGCADWPGETQAALQYLPDLRLRRLPFTSTLSYAVIGD